MNQNLKPGIAANVFAEHLQTMIKLDALENITQNLEAQLAESQCAMNTINMLFNSLPQKEPVDNDMAHEDLNKFIESDGQRKVPEGAEHLLDVDLDKTIATMKTYAEDLKKNLALVEVKPNGSVAPKTDIRGFDMDQFSNSLHQLYEHLSRMKLSKASGKNDRTELETRLSQLCQDVDLFMKVVSGKEKLCNHNQQMQWELKLDGNKSLMYDELISKLLLTINSITILLQNKN